MKRNILWVMTYIMTGLFVLSSCAVSDNPGGGEPVKPAEPDSVITQLRKIAQVSDIKALPDKYNKGFSEAYQFMFQQPIDHNNPSAGTMQQKVLISIRDVNAPTVVHTRGYNVVANYAVDTDLAYDLGANYMIIEHRYFGDSKNDADTKWNYLTTRQAADDQYAIIKEIKKILPKEWVSTGTSKDGMCSMFLRYYHPDAVDVSTVFCAPFMVSLQDTRVGRYVQLECGKGADKAAVDNQINRMIANGRDGIYKTVNEMYKEYQAHMKQTVQGLSFESYVNNVIRVPFSFYSYNDIEERTKLLPAADCADAELIPFFFKTLTDSLNKWKETSSYWDAYTPYYPYYIQTAKELGQFAYDYSLLEDNLKGIEFDYDALKNPKPFNPSTLFDIDMWLYDTYDNSMMLDLLNNFLPTSKYPILFVYSKNDPWTGARPEKINESVSKMIINPDGIHSQDINNSKHYSIALRNEIIDYVSKYVTPTKTAATRRSAAILPTVDQVPDDHFMIMNK